MKRAARRPYWPELFALLSLLLFAAAAKPSELTHPVLLVATERLANSALEETVVIAAPLSDGTHIGFIVSKPTDQSVASLFPEQVEARGVADSVFQGGPVLPQVMFAIAHSPPVQKKGLFELLPGVVVVFEAEAIDHIIETTPNEARYFMGMLLWRPGELEKEIRNEAWQVRPAQARLVFSQQPKRLWNALYDRSHSREASADGLSPLRFAEAAAKPAL